MNWVYPDTTCMHYKTLPINIIGCELQIDFTIHPYINQNDLIPNCDGKKSPSECCWYYSHIVIKPKKKRF